MNIAVFHRAAMLLGICVAAAILASPVAAQGLTHVSADGMKKILAKPLANPVLGAANADVTVVEYFDYNCPVCRQTDGPLHQLVAADPHVRLIYKDWPVFGAPSVYAAYCAFAAARLGNYTAVHAALIGSKEDLDSRAVVLQVLKEAGVDVAKLDAEIARHEKEFSAVLTRNQDEATGLGLRGTPGVLIGSWLAPGGLNFAQLTKLVAEVRSQPEVHNKK
jgi:protein-disulfide isomerase